MSSYSRALPVRRVLSAVLVLSVTCGLVACGAHSTGASPSDSAVSAADTVQLPPLSELTPVAAPNTVSGPTTAVIGGPNIAPLRPSPVASLPAKVQSHDRGGDTLVTVTDTSRVIALSLAGSTAEMIYAMGLGDHLVGRDISTSFPGSSELPVVTGAGHTVNAESVLALDPTLVITDGSVGPTDVVLQLRDVGIPVVTVDRAVDAESTFQTMQQIADALGVPQAAHTVNEQLRSAIAEKEREVKRLLPHDPDKLPRVAFLYIRGTSGVYYLFGEGSGIDSLIRSVGAIDVAAEIGWKGEKPMTDEALIALDPDVVLVMTQGLESSGGVDGLLAAQPSLALTHAGKQRRIVDVDESVLFAGGTRIPDVIDGLARALYAPDSLPKS